MKTKKKRLSEEQRRTLDAIPPGIGRTIAESALRMEAEWEQRIRQLVAPLNETEARAMADRFGPGFGPDKIMAWWREEQKKKPAKGRGTR